MGSEVAQTKESSRKVFQCSSCGTYYEDWNLFLHMRTVHNRFLCLICLGLFPNAKKLARHLGNRHGLPENNFPTMTDLLAWNENRPCHMMCISCENVFEEPMGKSHPVAHTCCNIDKNASPKPIRPPNTTMSRELNESSKKASKPKEVLSSNIVPSPGGVKLKIKGLSSSILSSKEDAVPHAVLNKASPGTTDLAEAYSLKFILSKNGLIQNPNARKPDGPSIDTNNDEYKKTHSEHTEVTKAKEAEADNTGPTDDSKIGDDGPPQLVSKLTLKIPKFIVPVDDTDDEYDDEEMDVDDTFDPEDIPNSSPIRTSDKEEPPDAGRENMNVKAEPQIENEAAMPSSVPLTYQVSVANEHLRGDLEKESDEIGLSSGAMQDNAVAESFDPALGENGVDRSIVEADVNCQLFELALDQPLDQIPVKDFLRTCLRATIPFCLYCYHARRIAVNAKMLAVHMITMHRFTALVDSITAEELLPHTIVVRLKSTLEGLEDIYFNLDDYDSEVVAPLKMKAKIFECFQCRFTTGTHKELYLHNRKLHLKTVLLCLMCKATFYNYSELLCHICPGVPSRDLNYDLRFRCYYCNINDLPSAFRLMVHLRKSHAVCEVCLEECFDQTRLSNHAWKHKLHHFCYRCGIAYRNKQDITRHLFWRHGCESELCKKCLQKRWPHIYHFCLPPLQFNCDQCVLTFNRAVHLRVHKRLHTEETPHLCPEDGCAEKFISRRILEKHVRSHQNLVESEVVEMDNADENAIGLSVEKEEIIGVGSVEPGTDPDNEDSKTSDPIMDMPAPNLSESDSSDDDNSNESLLCGARMKHLSSSDEERPDNKSFNEANREDANLELRIDGHKALETQKAFHKISADSALAKASREDESEDEDGERTKTKAIIDIWENFRSYQATQIQQQKHTDEDEEDLIAPLPPPILHVLQSDHDYACMYKVFGRIDDDQDLQEIQDIEMMRRSGKLYGGSCSCGSNCTCSSSDSSSTSSGNSSSTPSTSSSSSDSSSDDGGGKKRTRVQRKSKKRHDKKKGNLGAKDGSDKDNLLLSINDEIVTRLPETDLETTESDTDEDFYDSNPYKIAQQRIAEKAKLEEDEASERRSRKERRRRHKEAKQMAKLKELEEKTGAALESRLEAAAAAACASKTKFMAANVVPPLKLNFLSRIKVDDATRLAKRSSPIHEHATIAVDGSSPKIPLLHSPNRIPNITPISRQLVGSTMPSSSSSNVKRSKRRRIPNRFYGYSSDDDIVTVTGIANSGGVFQPTAPPNLTWNKEDLPSPSGGIVAYASPTGNLNNRSIRMSVDSKLDSLDLVGSHRAMLKSGVNDNNVASCSDGLLVMMMKKKTKKLKSENDDNNDFITHRRAPTPKCSISRDGWSLRRNAEEEKIITNSWDEHSKLASQIQPTARIDPPEPLPPIKIRANRELTLVPDVRSAAINHGPLMNRGPESTETKLPTATDLYCTCRRPYVEDAEMIACDGEGCQIEWFHFDCVGILMAPQGKWFCHDCSLKHGPME